MPTLRDALLPVVDALRGLPDQLGLRPYNTSIVMRTWSGSRAGLGTNTDTVPAFVTVDLGKFDVKVSQITQRDIIASGGLYQDQDLKVGPITPPFTGSSVNNAALSNFDPTPGASPTELFFNIQGPGMAPGGSWFKKVSQDVSGNFRWFFIVRRTAEVP